MSRNNDSFKRDFTALPSGSLMNSVRPCVSVIRNNSPLAVPTPMVKMRIPSLPAFLAASSAVPSLSSPSVKSTSTL